MKSINRTKVFLLMMFGIIACSNITFGNNSKTLYLDHFCTYEHLPGEDGRDTTYITCAIFRRGDGSISADTAFWIKGDNIILVGHVFIWDEFYKLEADRVDYDIINHGADAVGEEVIIVSETDSLRAVGTNAYFSRDSSIMRMHDRPTVYLNHGDSLREIKIIADRIAINNDDRIAYTDGNVIIEQFETGSTAERAIFYLDDDVVLLLGEPVVRRQRSEIKGDTLILNGDGSFLKQVKVYGHGTGSFIEPSSGDTSLFDVSDIKASELEFNFHDGILDNIIASGQAWSFYSPAIRDSAEIIKNNVSGDTIKLYVEDKRLQYIEVIGGAEGEYLSGSHTYNDSAMVFSEDTVRYASDFIDYSLIDSVIKLDRNARVENKSIALSAHRISYNITGKTVTAYAFTPDDSGSASTPVILHDGAEEIFGSYLEYSMETEKGLIKHSRTDQGLEHYTGKELLREEADVFYVEDGTYCSCEYDDANFHFWAKNMKMIRGDKLIARPVVFFIEKIPLFIIPYYIFPMETGRHSGFLPFNVGNYEKGDRRITNVGYYWAASEYWDLLGSFDYYENYGFNYRASMRYNWRYHLSGSLTGSLANLTQWKNYSEVKSQRWQFVFSHSQTVSPTFSIRASGNFISDKTYYTDYATDLEDRLNRNLKSQISFSKRWGSASASAQFVHSVALDAETRTASLPTASLSFPSRSIFGSPKKDENGKVDRKWYHNFYYKYGVSMRNYSYRKTDTTGFKSRKEFATINHTASLSASFDILKYLHISPSLNYQESWYKINETDQSLTAGIDATETYRRGAYRAAVSASTNLYGTVSPHLLGLEGFRHVITPSVSYSWAPEVTRHENIKRYTGVGGGGVKSRAMSLSLRHLFQAKIKKGEGSRKIDLLSVNSSVSYNFEAKGKKLSTLSSSAHTSLLKNISLSANMTHDLYKPGTEELNLWSPYLMSFSISSRFHTQGFIGKSNQRDKNQPFDSPLGNPDQGDSGDKSKWNYSISHHYSESGRGDNFSKRHYVSMSASFNLTRTLDIKYTQSYDVRRAITTNRHITIKKKLHCWEGHFEWTIDGSNKGFSFRINIITIPDIKYERNRSGLGSTFVNY